MLCVFEIHYINLSYVFICWFAFWYLENLYPSKFYGDGSTMYL